MTGPAHALCAGRDTRWGTMPRERTHWEGCWRERTHHECALVRVAALEAELADERERRKAAEDALRERPGQWYPTLPIVVK